MSSEKLEVNL